MTTTYSADVLEWLRAAAHPVTGTRSDDTGADLEWLTGGLGDATVVGLGESTRFSAETFGVRARIFRLLVREYGFRALAVQDGARAGERMDRFALGGAETAEEALAQAWAPLRTREMAETLRWIREFNLTHAADPVRVFGIQPPHAEPSDYDAVLEFAGRAAPERLAEFTSRLETILTAHRMDEHVQRHNGIHPGRPFAEQAREVVELLETLPVTAERDAALAHARLIREFHEGSVAGRGGFAKDERAESDRIIDWHERTGARIAYWDGISHTGVLADGLGGHLRGRFGDGYAAVAIGFHHGDLGLTVVPEPAADLVDAQLGAVGLDAFAVDLRSAAPESVLAWRAGPAALRVISGVYDPAQDAAARMTVPSLAGAFDVLIHIREATPVDWLPVGEQ
ncbi:erythromycin esterase family protein [Nocardia huaxiensis]|uniref:Erythromycin esterase family protein n=1 Tax=Nocardia huaxiensis TaxID=2755382 RepID=A0A7D6VDI6_9NOCA|nr:erythromycin esterase family protein [Nocardia huaxiensis]QLY30337.1 erythromycin esterase family protein [Nocardia huaxiensis]UFS96028.1 erythromycin esterase family protein [Nocardia huaxiensis]